MDSGYLVKKAEWIHETSKVKSVEIVTPVEHLHTLLENLEKACFDENELPVYWDIWLLIGRFSSDKPEEIELESNYAAVYQRRMMVILIYKSGGLVITRDSYTLSLYNQNRIMQDIPW